MTMGELERTYVISDLHLLHSNIIKYCNRPFWKDGVDDDGNKISVPDAEAMSEYLLRQIDNLPEDSILFNLGDVSMMPFTDKDYLKNAIRRMSKGNKKLWLILGNHDSLKRASSDSIYFPYKNKEDVLFKELGFDVVCKTPLYFNNLDIVMSHAPIALRKDSTVCNIHGHIHDATISEDTLNGVDRNRYRNVSCDVIGFKPIKLIDILDGFNKDWRSNFFDKDKISNVLF